MGVSIFLAKLMGLFMLLIALIWLVRKKEFETQFRAIIDHDGTLAISGINIFIIGLAIAIGHSIWTLDWRGLITLIGYLAIIQGILRLAFPAHIKKMSEKVLRYSYVSIIILAILGIYLTYSGFMQ